MEEYIMNGIDVDLMNNGLRHMSDFQPFSITDAIQKFVWDNNISQAEFNEKAISEYLLHQGFIKKVSNYGVYQFTDKGRHLKEIGTIHGYLEWEKSEKERLERNRKLEDVILENNKAITTAARWQRWLLPSIGVAFSLAAFILALMTYVNDSDKQKDKKKTIIQIQQQPEVQSITTLDSPKGTFSKPDTGRSK